jgi:serine phosphatase RsbU (regulator of sigma subunit)
VFLFLLGVFFVFSIVAFASDAPDLGRTPTFRFALTILISGIFPVFYVVAGFLVPRHFWKLFVPVFALHFFLMRELSGPVPSAREPAQMDAAEMVHMHARLAFDSYAIMLAVALGYACFVYVTTTEGKRYFRVHAEMELAREIHRVLVPGIDTKIGPYEFYGRSSASGAVGGDLIDLAGSEERWVAYVADVSGHGVAPGVVMGMTKSAARMLLNSGDGAEDLLARLNEVLFPLKKPDMFVTFCFLAKHGDGLRAGLAGHPAILHFCARSGEVTPIESPNMPLGILPGGDFASSEIRAEPGDVFALYTDGFLEPTNAQGEEFGLARLEAEFQKHAREPLAAIYSSLRESVARHGAQFDDQSLLLIRRV